MKCYTYNGSKPVSEEVLFERIRLELWNNSDLENLTAVIYKLESKEDILNKLQSIGEKAQEKLLSAEKKREPHPFIATTKFITAHHSIIDKQLTPEYDDTERESNWIKLHVKEFNNDPEKAKTEYRALINAEKINNQVGTYIHHLVSMLLKYGMNSSEYTTAKTELKKKLEADDFTLAKTITENDTSLSKVENSKKVEESLNKMVSIAEEIFKNIKKKYPDSDRYVLFSEMPMVLESSNDNSIECSTRTSGMRKYDGILGVADLIVYDKQENKVKIVDFKVCSRPYNQWYLAKVNEVDFQLAIYRAILADNGFDGNDIDLEIQPILFEKQDIGSLHVEPAMNELDANWKGVSRIAWNGGEFTESLRQLGIGNQISFPSLDNTKVGKRIEEDRAKIIDYESPKHLTKEYFIREKKIFEDLDSNGKVIGYKFFNKLIGNAGGWERADTLEELTQDGGKLDKYIANLLQARKEIALTIIKEVEIIKTAKATKQESPITAFLKSLEDGKRKELLEYTLGKYTTPDWQCVSLDLPYELIDRGILIFQNKRNNAIDIITIADAPLSMVIPISGHYNVLGLYYDDEQIKHLPISPLRSEYRNVKAIETVGILNTIITDHPDLFKNCHIGEFMILNPHGEKSGQIGLDLNQVLDNFDIICSKENANLVNNIRKLNNKTTVEYCISEFLRVIRNLKADSVLNKLLKDLDLSTGKLRDQIAVINELLNALRRAYPQVRNLGITASETINTNDPALQCYLLLSNIYNELHNKKVKYNGKVPKLAITPAEFFSLLGVPFYGTQKLTDSDGTNIVGLGNGMELSSPTSSPSLNLKLINQFYEVKYNIIRKSFQKDSAYIMSLTLNYVKNFNLHSFISSDNTKIWERLLVHTADGKVDPNLIIKNPYDMSNDLTPLDREFLKKWLWEINKYRLGKESFKRDWKYEDHENEILLLQAFKDVTKSNDSEYFLMPLGRASDAQNIRTIRQQGIGKVFELKWESFQELFDPRQYHNYRKKLIAQEIDLGIENNYIIDDKTRQDWIENVNNPYAFSFDLDYLGLDVIFQTLRKEHFDEAIMLTETMMVCMNFMLQTSGVDFTDELKVGRDLLKIIKGESIIDPELLKPLLAVGIIKNINSVTALAFRPATFLKELSFGMFTNFSRAWALKYGSNKLSFASVSKAVGEVWGDRIKHVGEAITSDTMLAAFTRCEQINRLYGIANEDLTRTSQNASMARVGVLNNMSRWMYMAQSAPDYYNRLILLIAKMIEDGCYDAHTMKDGVLTYDWKKDKRFNKLAEHGLNSNYHDPEYNKQKALYAQMCKEFEQGGESLIEWDPKQKMYIYGDITQAYTPAQRASIKEVSDIAYGMYDHESKAQIHHKFFGYVFLQFQTFLSAKYNLWLKGSTEKGRNTAQGKYKLMVRNGIKYYDKYEIDEKTGEILGVKVVPETELTPEEKAQLLPTIEWEGDFVEGLMYSILYTIRDVCTFNWKNIIENPQRRANLVLALHDLLIGMLFASILKFIFSGGSGKMQDIKPLQRILVRSMEDVGPQALTNISITPSFVTTLEHIRGDALKMFMDSEEGWNLMMKHIGATKDFMWNEA